MGRILIVDDDLNDRLMLKETFIELGFQTNVDLLEGGEHVMTFLESIVDLPTLILLDLTIGTSFCENL